MGMGQRRRGGGGACTFRRSPRAFLARVRGGALVIIRSLYVSDLFFFRKQSRATQFYLTSGAPAAALAGRTRPRRSRVLGPRAAPGTDARAPRRPGAGRALGQRG